MTPEDFAAAVRELLASVAAMTLATCADGRPWATDVYFAPRGYDLIFFSSKASRHGRNLAAHPACAATVHPEAAAWREIRGLQLEGEARPVAGLAAKAAATAAYLAKFPFAAAMLAGTGETAAKTASVAPHRFRPSRIRYLDNRLGFGARYVVALADGRPLGPPEADDGDDPA
jgi:uncharacterized protein YhbP (UPF0306 family)